MPSVTTLRPKSLSCPSPSAGEVLVQAQFSDQSFGFLHGREMRNKYADASCAGLEGAGVEVECGAIGEVEGGNYL